MARRRVRIDWLGFRTWAETRMLEAAERDLVGHRKMDDIADAAAKQLDEWLTWGDGPAGEIAELFDGPVLKLLFRLIAALLRPTLQGWYDSLKARGMV